MDFIPRKDSDKLMWNKNLLATIDALGLAVGLDAAEITALKNAATANATAIELSNEAITASKTAVANKITQLKKGDKVIRPIINKVKASSNYTLAIGTTLRIIGDYTNKIDYKTYKPKIKVSVMPGKVRIDFIKKSFDGMNIYTRLQGQTTWEKLAYNSYSPYQDTRPLSDENTPEHRLYMAIGVVKDVEVTQESDMVDVVFGG